MRLNNRSVSSGCRAFKIAGFPGRTQALMLELLLSASCDAGSGSGFVDANSRAFRFAS